MSSPRACLRVLTVLLAAVLALETGGGTTGAGLQAASPLPVGEYRIAEGSALFEDCAVCAGPDAAFPARSIPVGGAFRVRRGTNCLSCPQLLVVDLDLTAPEAKYAARGTGTYRISGVAPDGSFTQQQMELSLTFGDGRTIQLDSGPVPIHAPLPWIETYLWQVTTEPGEILTLALDLVAAPWPSLSFSTSHGFTPAGGPGRVSDGDLLDRSGAVLLRNAELAALLGVMPPVPDLGLDAIQIRLDAFGAGLPRPSILYSTTQATFSEVLGPLGHGDLLDASGTVVLRNAEWVRAFLPSPVATDFGLDAVAIAPEGGLLLSTTVSFFSRALGREISTGDILTQGGAVFRSEAELIAGFGPTVESGPGVDALYLWPHGEIWFSTERDFDSALGPVRHGDLLSDRGRIVARNRDLLARFSPLEDLADFGLDALTVEADAPFDECGFLVQGVECVLFQADCGGTYVVTQRGEFVPGDRVRVTGRIVQPCNSPCQEGDGCILGNAIEACAFDGCGRIVRGAGDCFVFEADGGGRYLLEDLVVPPPVGERIRVTGKVRTGCNSACLEPCVAIVECAVSECLFEDCGELVDAGQDCVIFETPTGERYVLENVGAFAPGDEVLVKGVVTDECTSECAQIAGVAGCIRDNDIESAGPVGEVGFFRRADCNADGKADLSDAVFHLLYLFSGGSLPLCKDACNSNGDGTLDLTDSVYTLNFFFTGGQSPPPPFPGCGEVELQIFCGDAPCPCLYPEGTCPNAWPGP